MVGVHCAGDVGPVEPEFLPGRAALYGRGCRVAHGQAKTASSRVRAVGGAGAGRHAREPRAGRAGREAGSQDGMPKVSRPPASPDILFSVGCPEMIREHIPTEVPLEFSPDGMDVICVILGCRIPEGARELR